MIIELIENYIAVFNGNYIENQNDNYFLKGIFNKKNDRLCYEIVNKDGLIDKEIKKVPQTSPFIDAVYSLIYGFRIDTKQLKSSLYNFTLLYNYIHINDFKLKKNLVSMLLYVTENNEDNILLFGIENQTNIDEYLSQILKKRGLSVSIKKLIEELFLQTLNNNKYETIEQIQFDEINQIVNVNILNLNNEKLSNLYFESSLKVNTLILYFFNNPSLLKDYYLKYNQEETTDIFLDIFFKSKYQDLISRKLFSMILYPVKIENDCFWSKLVDSYYNRNYILK